MKRRTAYTRAALGLLLLSLFSSCGEEGPTKIPLPLESPARPADLVASVGEREVRLAWEVATAEGVESYRIYRRDATDSLFARVGTSVVTSYADSGLVPGRAYDYGVASVGSNGIESLLSAALRVTPGSFGVVIDARAEYARSRLVALSFTVPADVNAVKIGNDSLLAGAFFETYQASRAWLLSDGDGTKRVFVRFRTSEGVESSVMRDDIVLDTRAEILSITEDSGGDVLVPGDTLRVVMATGESGGSATITFGTALAEEPLVYDSPSGTYRLARVITPDLRATDEVLVGTFVDRAGNEAAPRATTTTVTIAAAGQAPSPVTLATDGTGPDWVALSWTASADPGFRSYTVYRGTDPGLSGDAGDFVVGIVDERDVTGLVDSLSLGDSTAYYYRVFVEDTEGLRSGSNVTEAVTRNRAPQRVESFAAAPADSPSTAVRLTWTAVDPSLVPDFGAYMIYRSTAEAVSRSSELVETVGEILTRNLVDLGTEQATTYYYRIYVVDRGGLATGSDPASATTTDLDPSFVPLNAPNVDVANQNVLLSWDANLDPDFASYEIFWGSSTTQGGAASFALLSTVNNRSASSYTHYPEVTDLPFYVEYYLEAVDRAGKRTESNHVQAVFPAQDLPAISGLEITAGTTFAVVSFETDVPTKAWVRFSAGSLSLNRTASDAAEFKRVHSVPLESLTPSTAYYLQASAQDEAGATVAGTIRSFTTLPATR